MLMGFWVSENAKNNEMHLTGVVLTMTERMVKEHKFNHKRPFVLNFESCVTIWEYFGM